MFNIKIENFEGPLDLLLYFIKRDKIDIYDIPITQITNEYIAVIDEAKKLDINRISIETGAGNFFKPARKLFKKCNFELCEPFAHYKKDINSLYLTKLISND